MVIKNLMLMGDSKYGIDANDEERFADLGRNLKSKKGIGKIIVVIVILLILFDVFFMQGEIFINIFKSLTGK